MSAVQAPDVSHLVDLERYPIDDLQSPKRQALIDDARASLRESGLATFPGFLTEKGLATCVAEAESLKAKAYPRDLLRFIYPQETLDPSLLLVGGTVLGTRHRRAELGLPHVDVRRVLPLAFGHCRFNLWRQLAGGFLREGVSPGLAGLRMSEPLQQARPHQQHGEV